MNEYIYLEIYSAVLQKEFEIRVESMCTINECKQMINTLLNKMSQSAYQNMVSEIYSPSLNCVFDDCETLDASDLHTGSRIIVY